jgi:hypothetical protein
MKSTPNWQREVNMGLADLGAVMKVLTPANMALVQERIPKFLDDWTKALQILLNRSRDAEAHFLTLENRLDYLVREVDAANGRLIQMMAVSNLTPDIVSETIGQANADPRNHPGYQPEVSINAD